MVENNGAKMREWKVGEFAHYNCGSDTYPLVVVEVSKNGKTVKCASVRFTADVNQFVERVTEEDITSWKAGEATHTFKSRQDGPHMEGGKKGTKLHPGFSSYRDPSF